MTNTQIAKGLVGKTVLVLRGSLTGERATVTSSSYTQIECEASDGATVYLHVEDVTTIDQSLSEPTSL